MLRNNIATEKMVIAAFILELNLMEITKPNKKTVNARLFKAIAEVKRLLPVPKAEKRNWK